MLSGFYLKLFAMDKESIVVISNGSFYKNIEKKQGSSESINIYIVL